MGLPQLATTAAASSTRWAIPAAIGVVAVLAMAGGSYFIVPQTEVAFVKRFGKVIDPQDGPLQPGLHLKMPFIDAPDLIRITTDTFELPEKKAFTKDTQEITLRVGVTYRVPTTATYHLLYEIGKAGNVDIHSNIILLSNEVVREVLSKHSITEIAGEQREMVVTEIKGKLSDVLAGILRIEVAGVQINALDFSPQYKDAINQATLARTKTFAAQQDAERAKVEAQTRVTQAQAEADAQAARADGQARAQLAQAQAEANGNLARARAEAEGNLLKAKADAEALRLRGEGDAAATRARIEAAGGAENYVRQIDAQAKMRWNGQVPQFMLGGTGANGPTMPIILPMQGPAPGAPTAQNAPAPAQAGR
ncbi:MAG TPA: SPFH domain-containing protein [Xanthobacteraceae bacterium]|nr:SPFH domain-containing protein [Xanthobacteraceae bacterium]